MEVRTTSRIGDLFISITPYNIQKDRKEQPRDHIFSTFCYTFG